MHAADLNIDMNFAFAIVHVNGKPFLNTVKGKFLIFSGIAKTEFKKISTPVLYFSAGCRRQ